MQSFLQDLLTWMLEVATNWAGYATGGIIVALVWFRSVLNNVPPSRKFGLALAAVFLFLALFSAWREKHRALAAARYELVAVRDSNRPKLVGKFLQTLGGDTADRKGAGAWLELQIVNQGTPSIVLPDSWQASITTANGQIHKATLNKIQDNSKIQMHDGKTFPIGRADAIYETASVHAIERGSIAHGWLQLYFEGIKWSDLVSAGTTWEVRGEDVLGNPCIASFTYRGDENRPGASYYPGSGVVDK